MTPSRSFSAGLHDAGQARQIVERGARFEPSNSRDHLPGRSGSARADFDEDPATSCKPFRRLARQPLRRLHARFSAHERLPRLMESHGIGQRCKLVLTDIGRIAYDDVPRARPL